MSTATQWWIHAFAIGIGATAVMDAWAVLQKRLFGIPALDYRLVGRWLGHLFASAQFRHEAIAKAAPVGFEKPLGWLFHYATGIVFAAALLALWGSDWVENPTLLPALIVGYASIVFPFLVMQPAFGAGIAASRTPHPNKARLKSLVTHGVFAMGLYVSALLARQLGT